MAYTALDHDTHIESPEPTKAADADVVGLIPFKPETDAERDEVRRELEQLLASPHFKTTTRAPALLRQIVECTISGRAEQLKERVLGIEVFGRDPEYDTSLDPVVRVTASRIRQRIAKYYGEADQSPLRIQLPAGSYGAEFWVPAPAAESEPTAAETPDPETHPLDSAFARSKSRRWLWPALAALTAVAVLAAIFWGGRMWQKDDLQRFWTPVLAANSPITLCVGRGFMTPIAADDPAQPLTIVAQRRQDFVNWADALTLVRVSEMLVSRGRNTLLRQEISTSLTDLRNGPAVLIGAFNNDWVLRLTPAMRFRFDRDRSISTLWIVDSQNPAKRDWKLVYSNPYADSREDYGLITRVLDPTTERTVIMLGGLGSHATIAGGEFLTNPKYMAALAQRAPAGWPEKNLQIVFATTVINGTSGPPRILSVHTW